MTLKLYGVGPSRWVRPYWTLKELGVDFEPIVTKITAGDTRTAAFLAKQPFGKIPVLEDGDLCLFESSAICNYLADKYSEKNLIPKPGTRERALHDQWMSFVISDLEQPLWRIIKHQRLYPEAKRSTADVALAKEDFQRLAHPLQERLEAHLVGERFTVADIMMAQTLNWAQSMGLLEEFEGLRGYVATHIARPAFPRELFASQ